MGKKEKGNNSKTHILAFKYHIQLMTARQIIYAISSI